MRRYFRKNGGIFFGTIYALILRLLFGTDLLSDAFSLFSITFVWLTPIFIGMIPLFMGSRDQLKNWGFRMGSPVLTVVVFFTLCLITRVEDLICLWVLLIPYIFVAALVGLIGGEILLRVKSRKETIYSLLLIPFLVSPIEQKFASPTGTFTVVSTLTINSGKEEIWKNIVRVREIREDEYSKGFFNYAGIPRPLYAELDRDTLGATRTGHFENGLKFIETVTNWQYERQIGFDIAVVSTSIGHSVFDRHILRGNHFRFLNAEYFLKELPGGRTELTLSSSYQLTTNVNAYASWCGNQLLSDFQERLLDVIKRRCEK